MMIYGGINLEVFVEKQMDKLGDEYLEQDKVVADITLNGKDVIIEVDHNLYIIPLAIIKALEIDNDRA